MAGFARSSALLSHGAIRLDKSIVATAFVIFFFVILNVQIMSTIVPLSIVAVCSLYLLLYYRQLLFFVANNKIFLAYPSIVLLSATWSLTPGQSFYYGIQLCITIVIGVLMGASTTPRQLIRGLFVAMAIVAVVSIISGRTGPSAAGPVLIGVTGSKNMMGFVGLTLVASGMGVLFDRLQPVIYQLAAFGLVPLGGYIVASVHSASATVVTAAFVVVFLGFLSLRYLPFGKWLLIILALTIFVPVTLVIYVELFDNAGEMILQSLNKDRTMTGRAGLWDKADEWIKRAPEIGHGYRSFWLGHSTDSVGMLHAFKQVDGRGFQFHENFREILVDTGWVGLVAFLSIAIIFLAYTLGNAFLYPGPASGFLASMYLMLIARSPIETIILVFSSSTALLYACGTASVMVSMRRAVRHAGNPKPNGSSSNVTHRRRATGLRFRERGAE